MSAIKHPVALPDGRDSGIRASSARNARRLAIKIAAKMAKRAAKGER